MTCTPLEPAPGPHARRVETGPPRDQIPHCQCGPRGLALEEKKPADTGPKPWFVLLEQIAARLRATIPYAVRPTGAEDAEELWKDATAMAAQMLHALEARGKEECSNRPLS